MKPRQPVTTSFCRGIFSLLWGLAYVVGTGVCWAGGSQYEAPSASEAPAVVRLASTENDSAPSEPAPETVSGLPPGAIPSQFVRRSFTDSAGEHRYFVFVPPHYTPERAWPVVLFLHGAGEKGTDGVRPLSAGLGTALELHPQQEFLAVFTQCENLRGRHLTGWLADGADAQRAIAILGEVEATYRIDPQRRVICGWSMGGYGTWSLAAAFPEKWAAVLAIAGGETEQALDLSELASRQIPVWAIHGSEDPLIPVEQSTQLVERLNMLGGRGRAMIVEGAGHDLWREVFATQQVLDWLAHPQQQESFPDIDFAKADRLPSGSPFYLRHFTKLQRLPNLVGIRLGNRALSVISQGIPATIPETVLSGKLDDIRRSIEADGEQIDITLQGLSYASTISAVQLQAISGGRFQVLFDFKPLRLKIQQSRLQFGQEFAETGEFTITLGHLRPARMVMEIQPTIEKSGLVLKPLRQRFLLDDNNWFISPPRDIRVESRRFTAEHIVTGVVGGLYVQKAEVVQAVQGVIPGLLRVVEEELNAREAPHLAQLLWPLPALVPELRVAPGQVRTDRDGITMVFDLLVRTSRDLSISGINHGFRSGAYETITIENLPDSKNLHFKVSLDAVAAAGEMTVREGYAYIHLRDLPGDEFTGLTQLDFLQKLFPEVAFETWTAPPETGLRLEAPFEIRGLPDQSTAQSLRLEILAPEVMFEVSSQDQEQLLEIPFSLSQQIELQVRERDGISEALVVNWLPQPVLQVKRSSKSSAINAELLETKLRDAWERWSSRQSGIERSIPPLRFGDGALLLESFQLLERSAELQFEPHDRFGRPEQPETK